MGIKDKFRQSLTSPATIMNPHDQNGGDTNYFVQLESKYDYGSPTDAYGNPTDAKTIEGFSYPAEYGITQVPYGAGLEEAGYGTNGGTLQGQQGFRRSEEENDEFSEYLNLMVHFRERDWNKTLRKIDLRLLPPYLFSYLLAFMDRGNVGNAKVAGLTESINMTDAQYNAGLACFFVFYLLLEIPSQFILKRLGPRWHLSILIVACGIVMASGAAITTPTGFVMMRLALGICESGLFPGINYTLAQYYTREELSTRIAIFFASASIAGAFSGVLAFAISHLGGKAGLESWRWIWLLEGGFTAFIGLLCPWWYLDTPEKCGNWLTQEEKRYLVLRQRYGPGSAGVARSESQTVSLIADLGKNWQTWPQVVVYFAHSVLGYSISFTLPVLMNTLGFSKYQSYLIPVPIFVAACGVTILNSWLSDKRESRFLHVVAPFCLAIIGVALTIPTAGEKGLVGLSVLGLICLVFSAYSAVPVSIAWLAANTCEPHRAVAIGMQISLGGLGGLAGSFIYLSEESPKYYTGYFTSLAVAVAAILACIWLKIGYTRANNKRNEMTREEIESSWNEEKLAAAGDKSPHFRYMI